jgi:hypothetical protein
MLAHVKFLQDAGEIDRIGGDDVAFTRPRNGARCNDSWAYQNDWGS